MSAGVNNLYLSVYFWIHKISSTLTLKVIDSLPYNQRIPFTNVNIPWKVILLIQGWTGHLVPKQVHILPCTRVLITHFNIFHNSEFKHNMSPLQWDVTALLLHHNNTHADASASVQINMWAVTWSFLFRLEAPPVCVSHQWAVTFPPVHCELFLSKHCN